MGQTAETPQTPPNAPAQATSPSQGFDLSAIFGPVFAFISNFLKSIFTGFGTLTRNLFSSNAPAATPVRPPEYSDKTTSNVRDVASANAMDEAILRARAQDNRTDAQMAQDQENRRVQQLVQGKEHCNALNINCQNRNRARGFAPR